MRSHLTVADLTRLVFQGAVNAGPAPIPTLAEADAVEVDRVVSAAGTIALGGTTLVAAEILAGRQMDVRIEASTLVIFDLATRELLRTSSNPLIPDQVQRLRGLRPAGPPPRPSVEPLRVQRLADNTGVVSVCRQRLGLSRGYARRTLGPVHRKDGTVGVGHGRLAISFGPGPATIFCRLSATAVNAKGALHRRG